MSLIGSTNACGRIGYDLLHSDAGQGGPGGGSGAGVWYEIFAHRKSITVPSARVTASAQDFPLLVVLQADPDLRQYATVRGYLMETDRNNTNLYGAIHNGGGGSVRGTGNASVSLNAWSHLFVTIDRATQTICLYKNGVPSGNPTDITGVSPDEAPGNTYPLMLGGARNEYEIFGTLDEVRIVGISRSAEWIATEYANQNSPSTFHSVGALE